jgi:pyruvate,water dikinase
MAKSNQYVRWFETLNNGSGVGRGKNASLGEMVSTLKPEGIRIPAGFATTQGLIGNSSR